MVENIDSRAKMLWKPEETNGYCSVRGNGKGSRTQVRIVQSGVMVGS